MDVCPWAFLGFSFFPAVIVTIDAILAPIGWPNIDNITCLLSHPVALWGSQYQAMLGPLQGSRRSCKTLLCHDHNWEKTSKNVSGGKGGHCPHFWSTILFNRPKKGVEEFEPPQNNCKYESSAANYWQFGAICCNMPQFASNHCNMLQFVTKLPQISLCPKSCVTSSCNTVYK